MLLSSMFNQSIEHPLGLSSRQSQSDDVLPAHAQVMGEDLVLVAGQQDRMLRGADVWKHPVAYDKLAVRYRRWRNSLDSCDEREKAAAAAALAGPMSAGELFAVEAEEEEEPAYMSDLSESEDDLCPT